MSVAADIATALAARAEEVCRTYLPHGRRRGRYWVVGNLDGAPGRSLYIRLAGPGTPGKFTDAATGEHGDLLDILRHRSGAPTLRAALAEARAFLASEPAPGRAPQAAGGAYNATAAAPMRNATCSHEVSRAAASRRCASLPRRRGRHPPAGAGRRRHCRRTFCALPDSARHRMNGGKGM